MNNFKIPSTEEIGIKIINSGAFELKDVDNGEDPFVYSTGNRGPGYVIIKGLVGQPDVFKYLMKILAHKVVDNQHLILLKVMQQEEWFQDIN